MTPADRIAELEAEVERLTRLVSSVQANWADDSARLIAAREEAKGLRAEVERLTGGCVEYVEDVTGCVEARAALKGKP